MDFNFTPGSVLGAALICAITMLSLFGYLSGAISESQVNTFILMSVPAFILARRLDKTRAPKTPADYASFPHKQRLHT